jgi:hypothetical protein
VDVREFGEEESRLISWPPRAANSAMGRLIRAIDVARHWTMPRLR